VSIGFAIVDFYQSRTMIGRHIFFSLLAASALFAPCCFADTTSSQRILEIIAATMNTTPANLKVDETFSKQNPPADGLTVVEITMAVEEGLDIEIKDKDLDATVGATGPDDLAEKMTIKQFQEFVATRTGKK
jgi:acyl carrier protein